MYNIHIVGLKVYFLGAAPIPSSMLLKEIELPYNYTINLVFLYVGKSKYELLVFIIGGVEIKIIFIKIN